MKTNKEQRMEPEEMPPNDHLDDIKFECFALGVLVGAMLSLLARYV